MVFNATFNNISAHHELGSNSRYLVVKGTDCTSSCKSNYHMITTRKDDPSINI